ncbi:MAG TPA: glycosyltransferase family 4 protein [Polyangiaceae bacterium]|nr:glycosyltransferase family 4 protein [Polyangiaceae bacterium]
MRCLILAAGRFDADLKAGISAGREPRLDVFELANAMGADLLDFKDVESSTRQSVQLTARSAGPSAALAVLGFMQRKRYDAYFTTGEDIGLPLAALLRAARGRSSHTMIAHTLFPTKKQVFFRFGKVDRQIDRILVYSTSEQQLATGTLGVSAEKVERIAYHADDQFFRPNGTEPEPDLICAAGQLLRDYDCLIEAVRTLPVRVDIAAGSPWIAQGLAPSRALPPNITWRRRNRFELREMYAHARLAVVPILQNHYQTGIATILEMMSMGKCVIATRTHGQTDTIVDGVTGVYVPPSDPAALRGAIQRLLAQPADIERIGQAARKYVEENAGLDLFVRRLRQTIEAGHAARVNRNGA